jgi:hypothetical protein
MSTGLPTGLYTSKSYSMLPKLPEDDVKVFSKKKTT